MFKIITCNIGLHIFWKYKTEKHNMIIDNEAPFEMYVPVRECRRCGERQHHMMPRMAGGYFNWKPFYFAENEDVKLTRNAH